VGSHQLPGQSLRRLLIYDSCADLAALQIDPDTKPSALGPPFTGHFRVTLDTPRGLQPLHPGIKTAPQPAAGSSTGPGAFAKPTPANLDLRKMVYQTTAKGLARSLPEGEAEALAKKNTALHFPPAASAASAKAYACDVCGSDCTRVRYQSLKDAAFAICPPCYTAGRFPSTLFSGDFLRVDDAAFKHAIGAQTGGKAGLAGDEWSDQETLALLEGIEMYDDDWTAIADHVDTRSKDQCILKFLQLPIEDPYVAAASSDADLGALKWAMPLPGGAESLPFSKSDNPVMSVVAFLASTVGPAVAAAAAGKALGELTGDLKRSSAESEKAEASSGMEVDKAEDASGVKSEADGGVLPAPAPPANATLKSAPSASAVTAAADVALGAAAGKAATLAANEDRQIQALVSRLVSAQLKKLELKMNHFEQLEELVESERRAVELAKLAVYKEKAKVEEQLAEVQGLVGKAQSQLELLQRGQTADAPIGQAEIDGVRQLGQDSGAPEVQENDVDMQQLLADVSEQDMTAMLSL
jgi:SWI/SNF related-matrix-associated actin-dependent regulator of chromatin subfamily C